MASRQAYKHRLLNYSPPFFFFCPPHAPSHTARGSHACWQPALMFKLHMWPKCVPTVNTICLWKEELWRRPVQAQRIESGCGQWACGQWQKVQTSCGSVSSLRLSPHSERHTWSRYQNETLWSVGYSAGALLHDCHSGFCDQSQLIESIYRTGSSITPSQSPGLSKLEYEQWLLKGWAPTLPRVAWGWLPTIPMLFLLNHAAHHPRRAVGSILLVTDFPLLIAEPGPKRVLSIYLWNARWVNEKGYFLTLSLMSFIMCILHTVQIFLLLATSSKLSSCPK